MWRSEGNLVAFIGFFHSYVGSRCQAQIKLLSDKHLYLLNHLTSPGTIETGNTFSSFHPVWGTEHLHPCAMTHSAPSCLPQCVLWSLTTDLKWGWAKIFKDLSLKTQLCQPKSTCYQNTAHLGTKHSNKQVPFMLFPHILSHEL